MSLKDKVHRIIFGVDTPAGRWFDIMVMVCIALSILFVMMESVERLDRKYHKLFFIAEWILTIIFTAEYLLRIWCVRNKWRYISSFFGVIDLLAILPAYLSVIFAGSHYLVVFRAMRLLRVFRVFKLARYLGASYTILTALKASRVKITVFLIVVLNVALIVGTLMYVIEGATNPGFTSIPRSVYWAIVTMTTVGYGDIAPTSDIGQTIAAILMIVGYAIIAVPTGIVTSEVMQANVIAKEEYICRHCTQKGHDEDAEYCKYCGESL